jgi:hypothetical protein
MQMRRGAALAARGGNSSTTLANDENYQHNRQIFVVIPQQQ